MNVGIDLRPLVPGESGGIVQLLDGLLPSLFALAPTRTFHLFHTARFAPPRAPNAVAVEVPPIADAFDAELVRCEIDVLLRAYPTDEPLVFPPAREVTVVPDALHADLPEQLDPPTRARRATAFARAAAGTLVVPSRYTRDRLAALFPGARSVLVPPAAPQLVGRLADPLSPADAECVPTGPFVLYPARGWPHKNHAGLFRAWRAFRAEHPEYELVLTGTGGCVPELLAANPVPGVRDLGFVSERLLAELYRRAAALVYPSRHEGFGLPLLEAFAFGLPVVCGNRTSLPEVGGDAVLAVDPDDATELTAALARAVSEPSLRSALAARGRARLSAYDAPVSARELWAALERTATLPVPMEQVRAGHREFHARLARAGVSHERTGSGEGPLVSVVVAMGDFRKSAARCVRAWTREQTLPRERFEVIVVWDGRAPDELERVRRELGPQDRIVRSSAPTETALWHEGTRHARGRWLYFAEAHSYGEPECLAEVLDHLLGERVAAASSRSVAAAENRVALLEGRLFERVSAQRLAPGGWNRLFFRGCAIERAVYERLGGLRGEYGLFAEPLFSAELHRAGVRVGYARRSVVRHENAGTFAELAEHIGDYARHECEFRLAHAESVWDEYFGTPAEWRSGGRFDATLARIEARVRLRAGGGSRRFAALLPPSALGGHWWRWRAAARTERLRRRVLRASGDDELDAFSAWWTETATRARIEFLTALPVPNEALAAAHVADLPDPYLVGFHSVERHAGRRFRWSEPLAHVKLVLPRGVGAVEVETLPLRPGAAVAAFVNGRAATVEPRADGLRVIVPDALLRTGWQYLTLACDPLRAPNDARALGLAVCGARVAGHTAAVRRAA